LLIESVSENCRAEWNAFACSQSVFGLLQSWEWGQFKEKMGWKAFRIAVTDGGQIVALAQLLIKPIPPGLTSVAYLPRGPLGRWQDPQVFCELINAIHAVAAENHAVFLKIEPPLLSSQADACFLQEHGFHFSHATNQPRCTIQVDLTSDQENIFAQLRKSTRRKITTATNQGLTTRLGVTSDLPIFYELVCATARRSGCEARKLGYYESEWGTFFKNGQALMMLAFYAGQPVAAHLSYTFGKQAALFHQASADGFCALNPNTLLVWESLKTLKTGGCINYDLGSIPNEIGEIACHGQPPDHERSDGLWGPYQFKSDFCKQIVYYLGAYDYVYQPVLYALINSQFLKIEILEQPAVLSAKVERV